MKIGGNQVGQQVNVQELNEVEQKVEYDVGMLTIFLFFMESSYSFLDIKM